MLNSLSKFKEFDHVRKSDLQPMNSRGLAHDHVRINGTEWLLRILRGNQLGADDQSYLPLQKNIYDEMSPSGVTPRALGIITANEEFPHGAVIVKYIEGRHINNAKDLKAVAKSLGQLHKMTSDKGTGNLDVSPSPLATQDFLLREVFKDSFNAAASGSKMQQLLCAERARILGAIDELKSADLPLSLIGGDSHLGNYLIDKNGKAWLVDIEFATYDLALIDLADASLPMNAGIDYSIGVTPSVHDRTVFYHGWASVVGKTISEALRPHRDLAEKTVQLRTLAWLVDWKERARFEDNGAMNDATRKNYDDMADYYLRPRQLNKLFKPAP